VKPRAKSKDESLFGTKEKKRMGGKSSRAAPISREQRLNFIKDFLNTGPIGVADVCEIVVQYADDFQGHKQAVLKMLDVPRGLKWINDTQLAIGSESAVRVWDIPTNQIVHDLPCRWAAFKTIDVLGCDRLVAAVGIDVYVWNLTTGHNELRMEHPTSVCDLASLDDEHVVVSTHYPTLKCWNVSTGQIVQSFDCRADNPKAFVRSIDKISQTCFATGSKNGSVCVWSTNQRTPTQELRGHRKPVCSVVYLGNNKLASVSQDQALRLWDLLGGTCTSLIEDELFTSWITMIDPLTVVSRTQDDEVVRAWRLDTDEILWKLHDLHGMNTMAWNGRRLALCELVLDGEKGKVTVWH